MVHLATEMVKQKVGEDGDAKGDADGGDSVDGSGWSLTMMVVMAPMILVLALAVLVMFACFGAKFGAGGGFAGPCFGAGDGGGCIGGGSGGVTNGRTPTGHHGATGATRRVPPRKSTRLVPPDSESGAAGVLLLAGRCCLLRNLCNKQNI